MRKTQLGAPGADGRRAFSTVEGSDFDLDCGLVIAAVGQKAVSLELARHGLMDGDRISTRDSDMGTRLDKVFAAGDAAFGSSTLVQAMFQGHKAAYYVLAALEGDRSSGALSHALSHAQRAVAQDPAWEKLPLKEPPFLGVAKPDPFGDAEAGFTTRSPARNRRRAAIAATPKPARPIIRSRPARRFSPWRAPTPGPPISSASPAQSLESAPAQSPNSAPATFDELVFLPANLTRLVIDPYREACKTATDLWPA